MEGVFNDYIRFLQGKTLEFAPPLIDATSLIKFLSVKTFTKGLSCLYTRYPALHRRAGYKFRVLIEALARYDDLMFFAFTNRHEEMEKRSYYEEMGFIVIETPMAVIVGRMPVRDITQPFSMGLSAKQLKKLTSTNLADDHLIEYGLEFKKTPVEKGVLITKLKSEKQVVVKQFLYEDPLSLDDDWKEKTQSTRREVVLTERKINEIAELFHVEPDFLQYLGYDNLFALNWTQLERIKKAGKDGAKFLFSHIEVAVSEEGVSFHGTGKRDLVIDLKGDELPYFNFNKQSVSTVSFEHFSHLFGFAPIDKEESPVFYAKDGSPLKAVLRIDSLDMVFIITLNEREVTQ